MEGIWIDVVGRRDIPRFTNRDNCPLLFSRFYEGEPNAHVSNFSFINEIRVIYGHRILMKPRTNLLNLSAI